jgi:predicted Fe-Mo cluster-binding NifX family protein
MFNAKHRNMKIIIPCWQGRVSPLFDAAGTVLLIEVENGRELSRMIRPLEGTDPLQRVRQTVSVGADLLICGAISGQLECLLRSTGLQVVSNICGAIDDVLSAYADGSLFDTPFLLPGAHGMRRRFRNRQGGKNK